MSLTAHLAHDLGQEFNQYFPRTVSSVAHVAARHDAPDVIEWCFTCLAWVFKYLSRLLVQDLRPRRGIMKPYFSHRKDYVARFSAESLAFLLRKAAVSYPKRREPLTIALTDLLRNHDRDDPQAEYGSMALLVETCSGMERGVHSSANCLFQCLVNVAGQLCYPPGVLRLVEGAVISL
ncbi:MAG: U3 snoRNP protein, partial [Watsoniomyces obsoletus]